MSDFDDLRQLREQTRELAARLARLAARGPRPATPLLVGQVYAQHAVPTTTPAFFATHPVAVQPGASEGAMATFTPEAGTVMVRVIGEPPVADDYLVAVGVDHRWMAEGKPTVACSILVVPIGIYGAPIVGATVTISWNEATQGAYADPTRNDHHTADFTTTSSGATIPVDARNGIYLVKIQAPGFATRYQYVFGCGKHCTDIFPTTPLTGTANTSTSPRTITTNVQTSPFTVFVAGTAGGVEDASQGVPISGTAVYHPGAVNLVTGATFASKQVTFGGGTYTCNDVSPKTPGVISVRCSDVFDPSNSPIVAHVGLIVCPFTPPFTGAITPTDYGLSSSHSSVSPAVLNSAISNIQFSPLLVEGAWNAAYTTPGRLLGFAAGGGSNNYAQPGAGLTPLNGSWTIQ